MNRTLLSMTSVVALLALSAGTALAAKSPAEFVKDAAQGDNSEIMLGQLAQEKGSSQQIRDFGKTLVTDHSTAKDQVGALAKTLGVTLPDGPAAEAKEEQMKLNGLSGAGFDREFANYMVDDHKKDIADFQAQAKANDGPASDLANKQIPTLQKHLQMAEAIAGGGDKMGSAAPAMGDTLSQEGPDQWRASKLAGVDIYGPEKKSVGKVSDVLMSRDGKAEYIVIGVGGFLGIGQKDVAVPYDQVKFTDQPITPPMPATAAPGVNAMGASSTTGTPATANGNGTMTNAGGTTTALGMGAPGNDTANAQMARSMAYPDHGTIDMTADQLKSAPTFHFSK